MPSSLSGRALVALLFAFGCGGGGQHPGSGDAAGGSDDASIGSGDAALPDAAVPDAGLPPCFDGVKDGTETGVDCGGTCAACPAPLDTTVPFDFGSAMAFLYTGPDPYQMGVVAGTIDPTRIAVVRGRVVDRDGKPVALVRVRVHGQPAYGVALTRADGTFDFALDGGALVTLDFDQGGVLPVQRSIQGPIRDWVTIEDVVVIPLDGKVTMIDFSAPIQAHQGTMQSDADGDRTATLMFAQGTSAAMEVGGVMQPLSTLHVRATEFTVGASGRHAMPGELPASSGYTYAVELSVDEAMQAGATRVVFSKPVVTYVDNFLQFPTGGVVPLGYYDREAAHWVPADDGRVIAIVSITSGMADLDVTGGGATSPQSALDALGITDAERTKLATLYAPGVSLWRVAVDHFTPWDMNWPFGPPDDAIAPAMTSNIDADPDSDDDEPDEDCPECEAGSEIEAQNGNLGERLPIAGTTLGLRYRSQRVPGPPAGFNGTVPFRHMLKATTTNARLPASCLGIVVDFTVGGQVFHSEYPPTTGLRVSQVWDGRDAYGRIPTSPLPMEVRVGYRYEAVYRPVPADFYRSFERPVIAAIGGNAGQIGFAKSPYRSEVIVYNTGATGESKVERIGRTSVGRWLATNVGLGGFTLDIHHTYDPTFGTLQRGDGPTRSGAQAAQTGAYLKDLAINARDVAFGPDGSMYGIDHDLIWRKTPGGPYETYAGTDNPNELSDGDGGPALSAHLYQPRFLAVGPDGSVYVTEWRQKVRKILPDGTITLFAGATSAAKLGEGVLATEAYVNAPAGIAVARDGTVYFIDRFGATFAHPPRMPGLRSITTDGRLHYLAPIDFSMDGSALAPGGPLVQDGDGNLYVADGGIAKIRPTGEVEHVVGKILGGFYTLARGVAVLPSGGLLTTDTAGVYEKQTTGQLARLSMLSVSGDRGPYPNVRVSPAGNVYVMSYALATQSNYETMNLTGTMYGYEPTTRYTAGEMLVPSDNGEEVYVFDGAGRHRRTLSKTGVQLWQFSYDANGLLASIVDRDGATTTIDRDASGKLLGFTAPGGQHTTATLTSDGYLAKLAYPGGDSFDMTYDMGGLLVSLKDRRGGMHAFTYNQFGRLATDTDAASGVKQRSSLFTYPVSIGRSVSITTPAGSTRSYATSTQADGAIVHASRRTTTSAAGGVSTVSMPGDNSASLAYEDGSQIRTTVSPDPRWGMQTPFNDMFSLTTPGGKFLQTIHTRSVTLAVPTDPVSVTSIVDAFVTNGRAKTITYDVGARTVTTQWPSGRSSVLTLDAKERPVSVNGDVATITTPLAFTYDAAGHVASVSGGYDANTFAYDAAGHVTGMTDGLGRTTTFAYDASDHVSSLRLPSGRTFAIAHDVEGNLVSVQMPSGAMHGVARDARAWWTGYSPAPGVSLGVSYDGDGRITKTTLPDGRAIDYSYDAGRIAGASYPEATLAATYSDATRRVASVTRTSAGTGTAHTMTFDYDGSLVTRIAHSGEANGTYRLTYDSDLRVSGLQLDSGAVRSYTHDADGHVVTAGPFSFTRGGPGGAITGVTAGGASVLAVSYDGGGREASRTLGAGGTTYMTSTGLDAAQQPTSTIEAIAGGNHSFAYTYDLDGQLVRVQRSDLDTATTSCEIYDYDVNGNRTAKHWGTCGAEENTEIATYDGQDRLLARGGTSYAFDAAGVMTTRGADTFTYSARGELLRATVGGQTVTYGYDGNGRRVRRTDANGTTEYLYASSRSFAVTHSRNTVTGLSEYYYDEAGRLFAVVRGGVRYHVGTDAVGTPRIVVDTSGNVIAQLEYDAFGRLLSGNPGAFELPVGFGGGLPDPITGLVRLGYRDYDPDAGRFTARDPALFGGGQLNFYAYANNEPIRHVDRNGLGSTICDALEQLADTEKRMGPWSYANSVANPFSSTFPGDGNSSHDDPDPDKRSTFQGVDMNYFEMTYAGNKLFPGFGRAGSSFGNITQNLPLEKGLDYALQNLKENELGIWLGDMASNYPNIEAFRQDMCGCDKK